MGTKAKENRARCMMLLTAYMDCVRYARTKLSADYPLPTDDVCRAAVLGMMRKDGRGMRRSAPSFRDEPLGSILHRLLSWHRSAGNLAGLFSVRDDCRRLVRGTISHADRDHLGELSPDQLYDQLETLSVVLLQGYSPAVDRWRTALGARS